MTSAPVYNPLIPYVGVIDGGGFYPGRMVRVQGTIHPSAQRFAINLQCGPGNCDIALHVNPRFNENQIVRNTLQNMTWGIEESHGHMPLARGQGFEIIILCDPSHYKIAVNGQHYTEYGYRIPYQQVTHIGIEGDVTISLIQFEGGSVPGTQPGMGFVPSVPPVPVVPPTGMPYPPNPSLYPTMPTYAPQPGRTSPVPPPAYGVPPPGGYAYQPGYAAPPPSGYSYYPPPPPGYQQTSSSGKGLGGMLNKAGAAVAGALGGAGLMGALGSKSHHGVGHGGGHGMGMGTALGAGMAGAALTGHLSPKKALKAHKKSHKKALKYGIPAAGLGLGAYALSKGFHHGSSSSSSSSEEE